jgi:uncharacterized membrane protein
MSFIETYNKNLKNAVNIIEIFTYTIAVVIVSISIVYSIFIFGKEITNFELAFNDMRMSLGESISLALTFILAVEILKIFYIKTYKQLVIIVALTLLKLVINYFLTLEIKDIKNMNILV